MNYEWTKEQLRDWQNYNHLVANSYSLSTIHRQQLTINRISQSLLNLQRFQIDKMRELILAEFAHETSRHLRSYVERIVNTNTDRWSYRVDARNDVNNEMVVHQIIIPKFIYSYAQRKE